jgi:NTP pyrophosphatase (non-canonical NTP hydrolase)
MPLTFEDYQRDAARTRSDKYVAGSKTSLMVNALGLCGEAGEFAELIKKHVGHGHTLDGEVARKELGDILWYLSEAAMAIGFPLEQIAAENIAKLKLRYPDGFSSTRSINRDDGVVRKTGVE